MNLKRTQIYLEPEQHRSLKREAASRGMSLSELLREVVSDYLREEHSRDDFYAIVGLGRSGRDDGAKRHDHYLEEAVAKDEDIR